MRRSINHLAQKRFLRRVPDGNEIELPFNSIILPVPDSPHHLQLITLLPIAPTLPCVKYSNLSPLAKKKRLGYTERLVY